LGVVEHIDERGIRVRKHVAPAGSYVGAIATYRPEDLAVVPVERVKAYLVKVRAEGVQLAELAAQIEGALAAAKKR
jgi:hypothetical protein